MTQTIYGVRIGSGEVMDLTGPPGTPGPAGPAGADGKNYGMVVDGSAEDVLELKSVEVAATEVSSVNGYSGAVTLTAADVGAQSIAAPVIVHPPENAFVTLGDRVEIRVIALGTGLRYQWQYSDDGGRTWENSSLKTESYVVKNYAGISGRQVRCVVTDANGSSVTSAAATITLLAAVAASGSYNDLTDKPTIPEREVGLGWQVLTEDVFGLDDANVKAIQFQQAHYCPALGIVRFSAQIALGSVPEASPEEPEAFVVKFSKRYVPYHSESGAALVNPGGYFPVDGAVICRNRNHGTTDLTAVELAYYNTAANPYTALIVKCTGSNGNTTTVAISGFYYTEDIPSEEES